MIRICILGASLGTGNLGVSALACGTVAAALKANHAATVSFLDYGYHPERQTVLLENGSVDIDLTNLRYSRKVWLRNNIARVLVVAAVSRVLPERWSRQWRERYDCLAALIKADAVASLAGGDSFSDVYGIGRLIYVALPQILALQLGRPLVLLPQTLGPFRSTMARAIARYIISRAAVVYARDRQSLAEIAELMGSRPWKPTFSYDMAFAMASAPASERLDSLVPRVSQNEPLIGINVSGLLAMGGYNRQNMFGLKANYIRTLDRVVEHLVTKLDAHVLLVPHVFGSDPESDVAACRMMYNRLSERLNGRVHLVDQELDQHEVKYVIGRCEFFLSSRMHACIAALSQGVPAVSLAYSRKFVGVMESLRLGELVVDIRDLDEVGIVNRIAALFSDRLRIRCELEDQMPEVKRCVCEVFGQQSPRAEAIQSS